MIQIAYFDADSPKNIVMSGSEIQDCCRFDKDGAREYAVVLTDINEPDYKDGTITMSDGSKQTTRTEYMTYLNKYIPA